MQNPTDEGSLVVGTDGVTLDLSNRDLIGAADATPPDQFIGRAIVVRNARNVTIRNARIRGFKVAIYAENAPGLTIENCDVSDNYRQRLKSTPQKEDESDWLYGHDNDSNEWLRYGAGIYLYKCEGATVRNCRARNGQNGVCLVRCDKATVVGNDMSFMSGWGLAMWRSSGCKVIGNRFDYCVRGYSHGVYARGQDSAGILVYEQCSDNVFAYNHATHGGDGFFLYAGNETLQKTGEGGCNRNLVYMNNFSYAVANGIEATFSDQNVFLRNVIKRCDHGIWGGYSRRSMIGLNRFEKCANGVSIEHGQGNGLLCNTFEDCKRAVWLWWDNDRGLLGSKYAERNGAQSKGEYLNVNRFTNCEMAVSADHTQELGVTGNDFLNCGIVLQLREGSSIEEMDFNKIDSGRIDNQLEESVVGYDNIIGDGVQAAGKVEWRKSAEPVDTPPSSESDQLETILAILRDSEGTPRTASRLPDRMGTKPLHRLPQAPEGKEHILITEWGPWDFTGPRPTTQPAQR